MSTRFVRLNCLMFVTLLTITQPTAHAAEWFETYDYGPVSSQVISLVDKKDVVVRGHGVSVGTKDQPTTAYYDTASMNLRVVAEGNIKFSGTPWDGSHGGNSGVNGKALLESGASLAWSVDGHWQDPREDDYAPVPARFLKYKGYYLHGHKTIYSYTVGPEAVQVYEMPSAKNASAQSLFQRHFTLPSTGKGLKLKLYENNKTPLGKALNISVSGGLKIKKSGHLYYVELPADKKNFHLTVTYHKTNTQPSDQKPVDLRTYLKGGKSHWPKVLTLKGEKQLDRSGSFVVDQIPIPEDNPWGSKIRFGGFDFFKDGKSAAFCTWNGDVWIASGLDDDLNEVKWRRFAAGLNEALGICIVDGKIMVTGKDQITRLHDLNGDGEADFYECFWNEHKITKNFHEFTFGLQQDKSGHFYFAKGSPVRRGGRGFEDTHENHGVIYKVAPDGRTGEIFANGLRAPGGLGVHPDGNIVTTGENEGTYVPACKINYATKGDFLGVIHGGNNKEEKQGFTLPLCWLPMNVDNSGGGQVWVPEGAWGDFGGSLIHLSYGQSSVFAVVKEELKEAGNLPSNREHPGVQGGVVKLPIKLMSSGMRIRFNPNNQDEVIVVGFKGWQTNAPRDTAINRVRYTGKIYQRPVDIKSTTKGVYLTFNTQLDKKAAENVDNYGSQRWNYHYSKQYGSAHFATDMTKEELATWTQKESKRAGPQGGILQYREGETAFITAAQLLPDGKTVFLKMHDMKRVDQMKLSWDIKSASGHAIAQSLYHTIHVTTKDDREITDQYTLEKLKLKEMLATAKRGVVFEFKNGKKKALALSRLLALEVPQGQIPTPFLPSQKFDLQAKSLLQVENKDEIIFKVIGSGELRLKLNGKEIASFKGQNQVVTTKPISLSKDYHAIELEYASNQSGDSHFNVFWDGKTFPMEPISPNLLVAEQTPELFKALSLAKGREIFANKNCAACHDVGRLSSGAMPELSAKAPDLKNAGGRLKAGWLAKWIENPKSLKPDTHMPKLVNKKQARDIAAYLAGIVEKDQSAGLQGDVRAGGGLFYDLGCIACHNSPESAKVKEGRVPLARVAAKFKPQALKAFLKSPEMNHTWTRMPNFNLSDKEAEDLASFLLAKSKVKDMKAEKGNPLQGKKLFASVGCANCHEGLVESTMPKPKAMDKINYRKKFGCIHMYVRKIEYDFNKLDREAITAFVRSDRKSLNHHTPAEFAKRQVKSLNCVACHAMDGESALWEKYIADAKPYHVKHKDKGHLDQSRPALTLVGEKLKVAHMQDYLSGKLLKKDGHGVRDWLLARMPAFPARATLLSKGLAQQHAMLHAQMDDGLKETDELTNAGGKLVGQTGYNCTICHEIGSQKATAAFEVKGVNLKASRERLNYQYYQRWMLNPQHIWPNTRMPRYVDDQGKAGFPDFDHDGNKQFEAIWHYLGAYQDK